MKFEQYSNFANQQWQLAMSESEHFSLEKCTDEEKALVWDKIAETYDIAMGSDPRRVDFAMERLEKLGAFGPDTVALDIGSGTGAYTLALAKKCKVVYAIDSSSGMHKVLMEKAEKLGIHNIIPITYDWKTIWEQNIQCKFDIVISSLNTGINNCETLLKMNSVSRGFCCYVTPHGTAEHSARRDFQRIVFGRELKSAGGNDIIHPFNIIYGLGYQPELTYAPCEWSKEEPPALALEAVCREYGRYGPIGDELKSRLREYIYSHLNENGMFFQSQKSVVGIMIWDTRDLSQ